MEGLETEMQTDLGSAFPGHSSTKAQTLCTVSLKAHSRLVSTCCTSSDPSVQVQTLLYSGANCLLASSGKMSKFEAKRAEGGGQRTPLWFICRVIEPHFSLNLLQPRH